MKSWSWNIKFFVVFSHFTSPNNAIHFDHCSSWGMFQVRPFFWTLRITIDLYLSSLVHVSFCLYCLSNEYGSISDWGKAFSTCCGSSEGIFVNPKAVLFVVVLVKTWVPWRSWLWCWVFLNSWSECFCDHTYFLTVYLFHNLWHDILIR